jgi:hypothetical protein
MLSCKSKARQESTDSTALVEHTLTRVVREGRENIVEKVKRVKTRITRKR